MTRQVIERDKLGVLTKIGQGGQGVVYGAPNVKTKFAASMVFKEYKTAVLADIDFTALAAMPALVEDSLTYAQAERLISIAAWPCALVEEVGTPKGFVMPAIAEEFFIPLTTVKGVSDATAEFQHLLNHSSVLAARGITITDAQRYALLREVSSGLAFLHKHGVCVGDVSPKNLLFGLNPHAAAYFIDCDAMRINGTSVLPQVETPGWQVPAGEELATVHSDTYKLGLLALRLLAGDHDTTNLQDIPATTPDMLRQAITDTLTNSPHRRPLPEAWTYVLGQAIEYAQHQQKIDAAAPASVTPDAPVAPVVHSRPSGPSSRPSTPPPSAPPVSSERPASRPLTQTHTPPTPSDHRRRPRLKRPLIAAAIALFIAGASITGYLLRQPSTIPQPPPAAETALGGLLLNPDQINAAIGATGMTTTQTAAKMPDSSADVTDKGCLPLLGPTEAPAYEGSGWTAMRRLDLLDLRQQTNAVAQAVVLFSTAQEAEAFFTASAQRWPACRQFTFPRRVCPTCVNTVGPVSNANGTLSATLTRADSDRICQRALTVANNVAIDVYACSHTQSDSAVNIAHQIAAKVPGG